MNSFSDFFFWNTVLLFSPDWQGTQSIVLTGFHLSVIPLSHPSEYQDFRHRPLPMTWFYAVVALVHRNRSVSSITNHNPSERQHRETRTALTKLWCMLAQGLSKWWKQTLVDLAKSRSQKDLSEGVICEPTPKESVRVVKKMGAVSMLGSGSKDEECAAHITQFYWTRRKPSTPHKYSMAVHAHLLSAQKVGAERSEIRGHL